MKKRLLGKKSMNPSWLNKGGLIELHYIDDDTGNEFLEYKCEKLIPFDLKNK